MMQTNFANYILGQKHRLAMPLGIYPALQLTGKPISVALNDPLVQIDAVVEFFQKYGSAFLQTAIDLTVEPETFGSQIEFFNDALPAIRTGLVKDSNELGMLFAPKPGHKRTTVPLSVIRVLKDRFQTKAIFVLGTMSGPFTLAANLYGAQEPNALLNEDAGFVRDLLTVATTFLRRLAYAMKMNGADGIILVESMAGDLLPTDLIDFSTPYVRQIVDDVQDEEFSMIYHNSQARLDHLSYILEAGAAVYHFGSPMQIRTALALVEPTTILSGNLDPNGVFLQGTPDLVYEQTSELLAATADYPNFLLSSGGDLPAATPLANLDSFYKALNDFNARL